MAKPSVSNAISDRLISLNLKHGYRPEQYFSWAVDDHLADLTQQKKTDPPPKEVMPELFELGQLYSKEVVNNEPFTDVLGKTYMDLVSQGGQKMLGQYFTPEPVARMMSMINYPGDIQKSPENELYRVYEPSCGSGIMILQFCRTAMEHEGAEVLEKISLTAIDLDGLCAKMCAVQLLANAMLHRLSYGEILVLQGNSLGDPAKLKPLLHASHARFNGKLPEPPLPDRLEMIQKATVNQAKQRAVFEDQLELF